MKAKNIEMLIHIISNDKVVEVSGSLIMRYLYEELPPEIGDPMKIVQKRYLGSSVEINLSEEQMQKLKDYFEKIV